MNNFPQEQNNSKNEITDVVAKNETQVIDVIGEVLPPDSTTIENPEANFTETNSVLIMTDESAGSQLEEQPVNDTEVESKEPLSPNLTFSYEFQTKQEVTNIKTYLNNIWASYVPSLYKQINAGITSDVAKDTLWKVLNAKFFQINNSPQFVLNPNIVISSHKSEAPSEDDETLGLFCSLALIYSFKGSIEQLPFMNMLNILDPKEGARCITSINPNDEKTEIIIETLIEEENLSKFLEAITQRIQEENKKIQIAYSHFFTEHIQLIDNEYAKNQRIKEFFANKKTQTF